MEKDYKWHRLLIRDFNAHTFGELQARGFMTFEDAFAPNDLDEIKAMVQNNDILPIDEKRKIRFSHVVFSGSLVRFNIGAEPYND